MKKILLVVVAAFTFIATNVNAQETKFGLKAGVNYATLSGDIEDVSGRIGFHVGAYARLGITESFALKPELLYSLQGAQGSEDSKEKLNFSYLNIPVLASIAITDGLSIDVGPYVGLLLAAKASYDGESEDIKEGMNNIDFGVAAGLNYELESGLNFGLRYNLGLGNVFDYPDLPIFDDLKISNQVIQLSVGFSF